jgi:zinc protease
MNLITKIKVVACAVSLLLGANLPVHAKSSSAVDKLFEQVKLDYQIFTLPNGLTTLVYPDHSSPEVYVGVYYRVGSKDEPIGKTGFAHLYEHLMFRGTENAPGDFFGHMQKLGANGLNGTTSTDRTNYFQTVPTGSLDRALWLEGDRMANMLTGITQEALDAERSIVKNEKRQGELRPGTEAYQAYIDHLFPAGHPYDHNTIGSMTDLDNASLKDAHKWFNDYYGASNAVLVLSGDIDVKSAKQKVSKYFSDAKPGQRISEVAEYIPTLNENKHIVVYDKIAQTSITRVWPLPNSRNKGFELINFMGSALAGDKESPLTKRLKDKLRYVNNISFSVNEGMVSSSASLSYEIRAESGATKAQIDAIIDEELARFFKKGPNEDILEAKSIAADASLIRSMKNSQGLAQYLVESYIYKGNAEHFRTARQWELASTPKTLKKIAKQWLSKPYLEIMVQPEPNTTEMNVAVDRTAMPPVVETTAKVVFPKFEEATLKNGLKLVVIQHTGIPMIDVTFQIDTGTASNHNYTLGTAELTFGLMSVATDDYDENEIIKAQKDLATVISTQAGEYTSSLGFNSLTPYLSDSLALAAEMLMNPEYPHKEFEKAAEAITKRYNQIEQNPSQAVPHLLDKALWGEEHIFGKVPTRQEALNAVSRDQVLEFHRNEIGPNNTTVFMSGDITLKEGEKLLNKYFDDWKKSMPTTEKKVAKANPMTNKIILIDNPATPSAQIIASHMLAPFDKSLSPALTLINDPIGGYFQSRLNLNLRESKGWSYGINSSINQNPYYEQRFSVSTSVQTDKVVPSINEILNELTAFVSSNPMTRQEFEFAKYMKTSSYPSTFKNDAAYLSSAITAKAYGLPFNYGEQHVERLKNVKFEQATKLAQDTIKPEQLTWLIIGDITHFEKEIRALNIGDVEVWSVYGNKIR